MESLDGLKANFCDEVHVLDSGALKTPGFLARFAVTGLL
ncbi:hypothetical protein FHR61_002824 [Xanthomonas arboricola]|uniref:Transposase n=1 Tax=Xanthomonas cannabis TaxID=1885674 RepID=A0ABR6JNJ4_9XANT|nr:hypothetical protein [Xanthomonas cannabis]MBB5522969.1 hypothetical protein [Xanthomonas cannabis]